MRILLVCCLVLAACESADHQTAERKDPQETSIPEGFAGPVVADTARVASAKEAAAWSYRRTTEADLDDDGMVERVVLAANAEVDEAGEPIWEDGHLWAVYVEAPDSTRTLLYAGFVQLGRVDATVLQAKPNAPRRVLVIEHGPYHARALEISYEGPGMSRFIAGVGGAVESQPGRLDDL